VHDDDHARTSATVFVMNKSTLVGPGAASGLVIGVVIFGFTDYPAWIPMGLIIGTALGAAAQRLGFGHGRQ
jgi:F0F1-type ATP synthase assembly protein I